MLNTLGRNLNSCFTRIIKPTTTTPSDDSSPPSIPLFQNHLSRPISPPLPFIKTFNSLFDQHSPSSSSSHSDSSSATPDFATAVASRRFFFSSPGRSNSIVDSSSPSLSVAGDSPENEDVITGDGVAVPTYSPDPYGDFRRSMEEMVEARGLHDVKERWEELHELLTCYLNLNPKGTHKIIFAAFADLLVSLMQSYC